MNLGKTMIMGVAAVVSANTLGQSAANMLENTLSLGDRLSPAAMEVTRSAVKAAVGAAALVAVSSFLD